jgi:hypothetical protein
MLASGANLLPARCSLRVPNKRRCVKNQNCGEHRPQPPSRTALTSHTSPFVRVGTGVNMRHHDRKGQQPRPSVTIALAVSSQMYHNNVQQLRCQYGQGVSQEARLHGPKRHLPPSFLLTALLWIPLLRPSTTSFLLRRVRNQRQNKTANLT